MKTKLAALLVLTPLVGQLEAALVPGGDFQIYKPGTNYTVTATWASGYAKGVGDNIAVLNGTVNYSDATSGTAIDLPGWTGPVGGTKTVDILANGIDGTTDLNVFGAWSGGDGNMVESSDPLTRPTLAPGEGYQISVMVNGAAGPLNFGLTVDGAVITPDEEVTPTIPTSGWEAMTRLYYSLPAGDVKIVLGTEKLGAVLFGSRTRLDNVSFDAVDAGLPVSFPLRITPTAGSPGNFDFEWDSLDNYGYDLVSHTDPSAESDPALWPVWDNRSGLVGTAPTDMFLNVPGGGDPERFFAVVQKDPPPLLQEFFDDAAALPDGWSSDGPSNGTDWEVGDPTGGYATGPVNGANSGSNCAGTNILLNSGEYTTDVDVTLTSPSFLVPAGSGATLSFAQFIDTDEAADFGSVRILDAGTGLLIGTLELVEIGGNGTGADWVDTTLEMPAVDVGGKTIKIEFQFVSNDSVEYGGFYIDDVEVIAE